MPETVLSETALLQTYIKLPLQLRVEVSVFMQYIVNKYHTKKDPEQVANEKPGKIQFGLLKGKIKVPQEFNEPLNDFNEYMF